MDKKRRDYTDYLQDESFKKWVLQPDQESNQYWQEYLTVHPLQRDEIKKARQIILSLRFEKFPISEVETSNQVFQNVIRGQRSSRGIEVEKVQFNQQKKRKVSLFWSVAAAVLVAFGIGFNFWINSQPKVLEPVEIAFIEKENPRGRKSTLTLPDGTVVKLNADSKIRYPEKFDSLSRVVYLSGEAYFDVVQDLQRPFSVIAEDLVTTALGTAFNVKAWQGDSLIQIALAEGKVRIEKLNDEITDNNYYLNPGQKITHQAYTENFSIASFDPMLELGWKDGVIVFHHASLDEFVNKLSRWYDVEFEIKGTAEQPWSIDGRFENESLVEIMESLSFTYKIDYLLEDNKVLIRL